MVTLVDDIVIENVKQQHSSNWIIASDKHPFTFQVASLTVDTRIKYSQRTLNHAVSGAQLHDLWHLGSLVEQLFNNSYKPKAKIFYQQVR